MESCKTMEAEYNKAMESAGVMAFIRVVDRHPTATLGDVYGLAKEAGVGDITIGQLFANLNQGNGDGAARQTSLLGESEPNTRTSGGRREYDLSVLRVLAGKPDAWVRAPEIRAKAGGTPLQVRTSLRRLLDGDEITYLGQARATAYQVLS